LDAFWLTFQRRKTEPPDFAEDAARKKSVRMKIPETVVLPLQDAPDDPFEVFVNAGDRVKSGQRIGIMGKAPEHIAVHASISGEVTEVKPMLHPLGHHASSVVISSDGEEEKADMKPFSEAGLSDVFEFFREMGIPLDYSSINSVSTLLINVTEFDPYISSKERIILEEGEKFTEGLKVFLKASGAKKAVIVIEKKQTSLNSALKDTCRKIPEAEIHEADRPYPDTIQELIRQKVLFENKDVKKDSGADTTMVMEPGIAVAVYNAYFLGIPFTQQLVTVAGSGIQTQQTMWVKCGTPLLQIILQSGGNVSSLGRVTLGGTLIGIPQHSLEVPLIKKARGLFVAVALVFDEHRRSRFYQRSPCVRCGKCVDVCPACIIPNMVADFIENRRFDETEELGIFSCLECGLCYYVCPSQIPLVELIKLGKVKLKGSASLLTLNSYRTLSS
jgi:electron transport complex protein RnfC